MIDVPKWLSDYLADEYYFPHRHTLEELVERATNPEFEKVSYVQDWRKYVIDSMIEEWDNMALEARLAVVLICSNDADNETWD